MMDCYFSFWAKKIKIKKKNEKKCMEMPSLYTNAPKNMIICYTVPEIWRMTDVTAQNIKTFKEMKKTPGDIIILHMCTKNYDQVMYGSWDMMRDVWTDRLMDGWKK